MNGYEALAVGLISLVGVLLAYYIIEYDKKAKESFPEIEAFPDIISTDNDRFLKLRLENRISPFFYDSYPDTDIFDIVNELEYRGLDYEL